MDNTLQTYKQIHEHYSQRNFQISSEVSEMLDLFVSKLKGKRILDVGCANGIEAKIFHAKGLQVTGIDFTPEFIEKARTYCPEAEFHVMDMRQIDFGDNTFDGLWASASFLHIPKSDALKTLKEFQRVMVPEGILYLSVMEGEFNQERENRNHGWGPRHFSDYQEGELRNLLTQAGFQVDTIIKNTANFGKSFIHSFAVK